MKLRGANGMFVSRAVFQNAVIQNAVVQSTAVQSTAVQSSPRERNSETPVIARNEKQTDGRDAEVPVIDGETNKL